MEQVHLIIKKSWGFEPKNLQYQYYLVQAKQIPDINPNNPSYARKVKLWQSMPQTLCNLVGPYISNKIG